MTYVAVFGIVLSLSGVLRFFSGEVGSPPSRFEQYRSVFEKQTSRCGVGFYVKQMLAAQIEQESLWNPNAVSYANARGLTQFTSSGIAEVERIAPELRGGDPHDPAWSIAAQCAYMKHLVGLWTRQLDDPIEVIRHALATYNAGRSSILREWRLCRDDVDCDETRWYGNVDGKCTRLPENCSQSKHYVSGIESRVPKYYGLLGM